MYICDQPTVIFHPARETCLPQHIASQFVERAPAQFDGLMPSAPVQVYEVDLDELWEHCKPYTGYGCNQPDGIYVIRGKLSVDLLRHEIAHRVGWPADHPGAR